MMPYDPTLTADQTNARDAMRYATQQSAAMIHAVMDGLKDKKLFTDEQWGEMKKIENGLMNILNSMDDYYDESNKELGEELYSFDPIVTIKQMMDPTPTPFDNEEE